MKNNRNMKRRGFTLVELLIVIVVIGVLSAMMMLSATESVSSARASNIVSNLRNLKTAALAYYVDNMDTYDTITDSTPDISTKSGDVLKYLSEKGTNSSYAGYGFVGKAAGSWYVYYNVTNDGNVKSKLNGRASSTGLIGKDGDDFVSGDRTVYNGNTHVAMFIR